MQSPAFTYCRSYCLLGVGRIADYPDRDSTSVRESERVYGYQGQVEDSQPRASTYHIQRAIWGCFLRTHRAPETV
jgi:hypothetical protein